MRNFVLSVTLLIASWSQAQNIQPQQTEGIDYFLPKTAIRLR